MMAKIKRRITLEEVRMTMIAKITEFHSLTLMDTTKKLTQSIEESLRIKSEKILLLEMKEEN